MSAERISLDEKGKLDEIVALGGAHLEYMGDGQWFVQFIYQNGDATAIWFTSKSLRRAHMEERKAT